MSHRRPPRDFVARVAQEEAAAAGVSLSEILSGVGRRAIAARRKALSRIKRATGCSTYGLATVFGCDHGAVIDALKQEVSPTVGPYDVWTAARLRSRYGNERADAIMAGRDPATIADIAAWNALGTQQGRAA